MTQLFQAAAPHVVPPSLAEGRTAKPGSRFARAASLLAVAGLAGCADALTEPAQQPSPAPRMEVSAANVVGQYSIPVPANSMRGNTVPWTNTGITVPRAGKYRIRVRGFVTASQHALFPGPCPAVVPTQYAGDWGPMGRPELGTHLRVAVYTQAAQDWGFPVTVIDPQTIETEQQLEAGTQIWAARQGLGLDLRCTEHPDPVPVFAFTGSQTLTVEEITEPKLECRGPNGENPIERGKRVRCAITPDKPYKVVSRRAAGERFTNSARPDSSHPANTPYVWQGPAVADTRMTVVLELTKDDGSTERKSYNASFQAAARDWPKLTLNDPTVTIGLRDMEPYPPADGRGELGNARTEADPAANFELLLAPGGPNAGLMYFKSPWPAMNFTIVLHRALFDDPANPRAPWQVWHADQNGRGSGTCTQDVFNILVPAVRRHEGETKAPNSHYGIARAFFQSSEVEQELERMYRQTTSPDVLLNQGADRLRAVLKDDLTPLQEAFDDTDTPALLASLGCRLDHRRADP